VYRTLIRLFPTRPAPTQAHRIVLILPCCIGDVVLATATLSALRRAFPHAHITWAVGTWSQHAIATHPALDAILDTGASALPVKSTRGFVRFVRQMRAGHFDLAVSLVRSPLMSAALLLSGIPYRAGIDSGGRGFGYNIRASITPTERRHEAQVYLDVALVLGLEASNTWANVPVVDADKHVVRASLAERGIHGAFIVGNPAGGNNPGMVMDAKRYPPPLFADLLNRLSATFAWPIVLIGGPKDADIVAQVQAHLSHPAPAFVGTLSFAQIAALAAESALYVGNDTGMTHLAAAAGAPTAMILGPSDPQRYAPFTPRSIAIWREAQVSARGVADGLASAWDWPRDGVSVDEAYQRIVDFVRTLSG